MKPTPNNTGKVLTRYTRAAGSTTMSLSLNPSEASQLKAFVSTLRLRGDKQPSMTLIARRAVLAYLSRLKFSAETKTAEIAVLEEMATRYTDRKNVRAE